MNESVVSAIGYTLIAIELFLIIFFIIMSLKRNMVISKKAAIYAIPCYILLYFIYAFGSYYSKGILDPIDLITAITSTMKTFVLDLRIELVRKLLEEHVIFLVAYAIAIVCSSLAIITAFLGLFRDKIINNIRTKKVLKCNAEIILGYSEDGLIYAKNSKNAIVVDEKLSKENIQVLIKNKIPFIHKANAQNKLISLLKNRKNEVYYMILFKDRNNTIFAHLDLLQKLIDKNVNINFHIEVDIDEMNVIRNKFLSNLNPDIASHVTCFNKYERNARYFIKHYPLSAYIPRDFFNENLSIKNDKSINVVFLGMGKVNYALLRLMLINNQFAEVKNKEFHTKKVNYHIYDQSSSQLSNDLITKFQYEYDNLPDEDKEYYPRFEKSCEIICENRDIKSIDTNKKLSKIINKNSFTCLIVSFGGDFENAAYASQLYEQFKEQGNIKIFARINDHDLQQFNNDKDAITYFGEGKQLLDFEHIVDDNTLLMAKNIHNEYCKKINSNGVRSQQNIIKYYSNIYHSLSLYFKINLICDHSKSNDVDIKEQLIQDFKVTDYKYKDYFKLTKRNIMAFCEHSRWCTHYFIMDYKPLAKTEIRLDKDGNIINQDADKKKHACLTSFKGLDEYHKDILKIKRQFDKEVKIESIEVYQHDLLGIDKLLSESIGDYLVERKKQ